MYTFDSRVRYSEVDESGVLSLSSVINYMQDCSTFQSEDLGLGVRYLKEHRHVWLLHSWQIEIERQPALAEKISVSTWAYGFKGMYGYRNFAIDGEDGRLIKANSIWVFYDTDRKRPVKVMEDEVQGYGCYPRLDMEYAERKIAMPEGGEEREPFPVRQYQIDTNGHVNNGQYIRMAQEFVPRSLKPVSLRAEYRKSAVYGDILYPVSAVTEGGCTVSLNDAEGKPYVIAEFRERNDCAQNGCDMQVHV